MYTNQVGSSMVFEYNTEKVTNYLQSAINSIPSLKGIRIVVGAWDKASTKFVPFIVTLNGANVFQNNKKGDIVAQSGLSDYEMFKKLYPNDDEAGSGGNKTKLNDDLFKLIYRYGFNNRIALERDPNSYIDLIHNAEFKQALNIKRDSAFLLDRVFKGPRELKDDSGKSAVVFLNPVYVLRDMARDDMGVGENDMNAYNVALVGIKKNSEYNYSYLMSVETGTMFYGQKIERGSNELDRATSKLFMGQKF